MNTNRKHYDDSEEANRDPISHEPGAHPVGTGIGAAGIGAAGTLIGGIVAGPVGAVVGAAGGAIAGGLLGKGVAEEVDPTVEEVYWRENYASRPYAKADFPYSHYEPAYRVGYEGYKQHARTGRAYEDVEPELQRHYETTYPNANLKWTEARHASRDAWYRLEQTVEGDRTMRRGDR